MRNRISQTVWGINEHGAWGDFTLTEEKAATIMNLIDADFEDDDDMDLSDAMTQLEQWYPWLAECELYSFDPYGSEVAYQGLFIEGLEILHPGMVEEEGWDEDDPNVCDPTEP